MARSSYIPQIDGLRCLAMFLVIASHWLHIEFISYDLQTGKIGVELFFVISGFLITRILLGYKENAAFHLGLSVKEFYLRRVLRIFPMYYLVIGLLIIFNTGNIRETWEWHVGFASNFLIYFQNEWLGPLTPLWSLAAEEQFYLIWPLLVLLVPKKYFITTMIIMAVVGVGCRTILYLGPHAFLGSYVLMPCALDLFAAGGILAYMSMFQEEKLKIVLKSKLAWILVPLLAFAPLSLQIPQMGFTGYYFIVVFRLISALIGFFLVGNATYGIGGVGGKILSHKWVVYLGKISFSMYLFHNFIPGFYLGTPWPESEIARAPMYLVSLIIISSASWFLIERPFQILKNKIAIS